MRLKHLLRKNIEPRCAYCTQSTSLSDRQKVICRRHGVMNGTAHCRAFRYDPLRRIPPKPAAIRGQFTAEDFSLEDKKI